MITAIVTASADAEALARLLSALVPAAAEGLVREVAVLGASGAAAEVADDAGASLYAPGAFGEAAAGARGDWLAGLPLEARFAPDWMRIVGAHVAAKPQAARLVASGFSLTWRPEGWLAPRTLATSVGVVEQDLQRLARLSGRRLRIFRRG